NEIPAGWVEHTDLRGRVPAGQGTGNFATLGAEIGEAEHTLTENELPAHKHAPNNIFNNFITFGNKIGNGYTVSGDTNDKGGYVEYALGIGNQRRYNQRDTEEKSVGQGQAFNVVQPTRIVKFIRFVGFD
ncbi:phage baseplate protein, partial [Ornithobacterium rhinotracheale]